MDIPGFADSWFLPLTLKEKSLKLLIDDRKELLLMGYEMVRGPFMLYETVAMLYKFTNGITFPSVLSRMKLKQGAHTTKAAARRLNRLQAILEEVCADLDPQDPLLQRYFGRVVSEGDETCLASLITESFGSPTGTCLRTDMERICRIWKENQASGGWIRTDSPNTLSFSHDEGGPGDLFSQVQALQLPAELKLNLYGVLRNFEACTEELAQFLEPLAKRLEEHYRRDIWLLEETESYWKELFDKKHPIAFLRAHIDNDVLKNAGEETRVAILLMDCSRIHYWIRSGPQDDLEQDFICIGCGINTASITRRQSEDLESVGEILRAMGDKRRLEVLRRLSKDRMYLHELAESMDMDPGSMSRILASLHNHGFLRQERQALRNYYQTDREALHGFLELVETVIFE